MMQTMVEDECTCDEYHARLKMCRIEVGRERVGSYLKGRHPETGLVMVKDPTTLTHRERADAIAHYEAQYGEAAGDC